MRDRWLTQSIYELLKVVFLVTPSIDRSRRYVSYTAFNQFQTELLSPLQSQEARAWLSWLNVFREILLAQGTSVLLGHRLDPQSAFSFDHPQNFPTDLVGCILYLFIAAQMQHINLGGGCG